MVSLYLIPFSSSSWHSPVHSHWEKITPKMSDMPKGWLEDDLSSGLDPIHLFPNCEYLFISIPFILLIHSYSLYSEPFRGQGCMGI